MFMRDPNYGKRWEPDPDGEAAGKIWPLLLFFVLLIFFSVTVAMLVISVGTPRMCRDQGASRVAVHVCRRR
jgi:hypothetical protein